MPRLIDLTGQRFGRWTVVGRGPNTTDKHARWVCKCDCGTLGLIVGHTLRSKASVSCGCYRMIATRKHGATKRGGWVTREYRSWSSMKDRCLNPNTARYKRYGGRGIMICDRWRDSFEAFLSDMGPRPPATTLDRFPNPDGNYEPGNCRWATQLEQGNRGERNGRAKLTIADVRMVRVLHAKGFTVTQLASAFGVHYKTMLDVVERRHWQNVP